jgi:hypothetical protein
VRIQPKRGKPREVGKVCYDPRVEAAITRDQVRWKCSRSWVMHTALAAFYDVDIITPQTAKPAGLRIVKGRKKRAA